MVTITLTSDVAEVIIQQQCLSSTFLDGGVQLCDLHCQQVHSLLQTAHPQVETVGLCEQLTKDVLRMTTCTDKPQCVINNTTAGPCVTVVM